MRALTAGLGLAGTGRQGGGDGRDVVDLYLGSLLIAQVGADGKRRYGGPKRAAREKFAEREPRAQPEPRQSVVWTASVGRDLIRGVVQRNKPAVRRCFREGLERDPGLRGEVEVAFTIQGDGSVASPSVVRSSRIRYSFSNSARASLKSGSSSRANRCGDQPSSIASASFRRTSSRVVSVIAHSAFGFVTSRPPTILRPTSSAPRSLPYFAAFASR